MATKKARFSKLTVMTFLGKLKTSATCPEEVAGIEKVIAYVSAGSVTKDYLKEESNTGARNC